MKMLLRNFTHTFGRFITVNLMNLLGLAIAFAAFFIIMTQVDYDYNYDKGYKEYEKIYRLEVKQGSENDWQIWVPRPLCELIETCSPHILSGSLVRSSNNEYDIYVDENKFTVNAQLGFSNFIKVFDPDMIAGTTDALKKPSNVLLPASVAMQLYGSTDVVGKTMFLNKKKDKETVVGGVFKDFAPNSTIGNTVMVSLSQEENKDNWQNWNYTYYIKVDNPQDIQHLSDEVLAYVRKSVGYDKAKDFYLRFTPIANVHFSKVSNGAAGSKTSMYLLLCSSILIVLIAGINFTNFSLAETPMRIKSINTQKVLGGSTLSLRASLVIESMLISFMAFLIALVLLHIAQASPLQELVDSSIKITNQIKILFVTLGVSLVIGLFAGLYPSYYVTSFPPALVLKGSFGLSTHGQLLRTSLVCFQFIVSFVLICCVGVMYLQSHFIRISNYGYDKEQILVGRLDEVASKQTDAIISDLKQLSGVEGVAISNSLISSGDGYMGWGRGDGTKEMNFSCLPVDYNYLNVMGIKLIEGRNFKSSDGDVYIFNEAAKKKYDWLELDKQILTGDYPVIGFCENIKFCSFRVDNNDMPMAFMVFGEDHKDWYWKNYVNVRVAAGTDKIAMCKTLQKEMEKFSPGYDFQFKFMNQVLNDTYKREQLFTQQILLFSLLTILISIIGVLGLTMFESEYRRKEIGIRKVMGSSTREILLMFNKRYLKILIGCFIVSAPTAWYLSHNWLQQFVERTPISLWIFALAFVLVAAITICVVTYQSWKNANENPIESIKTE